MKITPRSLFLTVLLLVVTWFLYLEREILLPFVGAALFAYVLFPVVYFLTNKIHLPKTLSITLIYLFLLGSFGIAGFLVINRLFQETKDIVGELQVFLNKGDWPLIALPGLSENLVKEIMLSLRSAVAALPSKFGFFFSSAIQGLVSFIIFLIAGFYFLKDGNLFAERALNYLPKGNRVEIEILINRINQVLGGFLRGELLIVGTMGTMVFILLSILGVKYALTLAIVAGFAQLIPYIGISIMGVILSMITAMDGFSRFQWPMVYEGLAVVVGIFAINQIQDWLVTPHIMGKVTQLHPFVALFAVLAGGHLFGVWGMILAVPLAASLRLVLRYLAEKSA